MTAPSQRFQCHLQMITLGQKKNTCNIDDKIIRKKFMQSFLALTKLSAPLASEKKNLAQSNSPPPPPKKKVKWSTHHVGCLSLHLQVTVAGVN